MAGAIFILSCLAAVYIGILGWKKSTSFMGLAALAFIVLYVGSLMLGSTDGIPISHPSDGWSPIPERWVAGPWIRSFMETGAIGELIAMPALGIAAVGFIMMLFFRDMVSVGVFLAGIALSALAGLTDSHNAEFDAVRHSGALIKYAAMAAIGIFGLWFLLGRKKS